MMEMPSNLPPRVEPAFPIRLLALDIDGTLVGDSLVIGPRTQRAVRAASKRGVAVSLVTGRMVSSAMRFARELDLTAPIVGYQGGLIREIPPTDSTRLGRLLVHTPWRRPSRATSWSGPANTASTRTSTTSSGSSCAPTIRGPTTTRHSWAPARSSSRTSLRPRPTR